MDLKNTNVDGGSQDVVAVAEINIFLGARHFNGPTENFASTPEV